MHYAYRNVVTGKTCVVSADGWSEANVAIGFMLCEMERLATVPRELAPVARLMRFEDMKAFKAWRKAAWKLYNKYHTPCATPKVKVVVWRKA